MLLGSGLEIVDVDCIYGWGSYSIEWGCLWEYLHTFFTYSSIRGPTDSILARFLHEAISRLNEPGSGETVKETEPQ